MNIEITATRIRNEIKNTNDYICRAVLKRADGITSDIFQQIQHDCQTAEEAEFRMMDTIAYIKGWGNSAERE